MTIRIRAVQPSDESRWRALWAGYLVFYETDLAPEITDLTWRRLLDESEPMHCLVAEADGQVTGPAQVIGMVNYIFHRATWSATSYSCSRRQKRVGWAPGGR